MWFDEWACAIDWPGFFSSIESFLITASAVITAGAACYGVRTWRLQIKGKAKYDLAKRLMKVLLLYQKGLDELRSPWWVMLIRDSYVVQDDLPIEYIDHAKSMLSSKRARDLAQDDLIKLSTYLDELSADIELLTDEADLELSEDIRLDIEDLRKLKTEADQYIQKVYLYYNPDIPEHAKELFINFFKGKRTTLLLDKPNLNSFQEEWDSKFSIIKSKLLKYINL